MVPDSWARSGEKTVDERGHVSRNIQDLIVVHVGGAKLGGPGHGAIDERVYERTDIAAIHTRVLIDVALGADDRGREIDGQHRTATRVAVLTRVETLGGHVGPFVAPDQPAVVGCRRVEPSLNVGDHLRGRAPRVEADAPDAPVGAGRGDEVSTRAGPLRRGWRIGRVKKSIPPGRIPVGCDGAAPFTAACVGRALAPIRQETMKRDILVPGLRAGHVELKSHAVNLRSGGDGSGDIESDQRPSTISPGCLPRKDVVSRPIAKKVKFGVDRVVLVGDDDHHVRQCRSDASKNCQDPKPQNPDPFLNDDLVCVHCLFPLTEHRRRSIVYHVRGFDTQRQNSEAPPER